MPTKDEKGRIILENIWLIAIIILIIGIGLTIGEYYYFGRSFVGEILISGGFFGIFVYLIIGRHEKYVLRENILGLRPDLTLIDQLLGQVTFRDYFYDKRIYDWELTNHGHATMWAVRLHDTIHMKTERDTMELVMIRESDTGLTQQNRMVTITDRTTNASTNVQLQHIADLSTNVKTYYLLRHDFRKDHEYELKTAHDYPPNMKKNGDYVEMETPVYTRSLEIHVKLPTDFDFNLLRFGCFIVDTRYVKVRTLNCNCDSVTRTITITSDGPVLAGETIYLKYFPE